MKKKLWKIKDEFYNWIKNEGQKWDNRVVRYKNIIKTGIEILGLLTLVIGVWSIREDVKTRNSEYRPFLAIEETEKTFFTVKWNEEELDEKPYVTGTLPKLKLVNVGNGNAVNVSIEVCKHELREWKSALAKMGYDIEKDYLENEEKLKEICSYVLKGTENYVEVDVPQIWLKYFAEICKWNDIKDNNINLPFIKFKIKYYDVQYELIDYDYVIAVELNNTSTSVSNNREKSATYSIEFKRVSLDK